MEVREEEAKKGSKGVSKVYNHYEFPFSHITYPMEVLGGFPVISIRP